MASITLTLNSSMLSFWYKFIPKGRAAIEMNRGEVYYNMYVKNNLHDFMSNIFEDIGNVKKSDCKLLKKAETHKSVQA